MAEYIPDEPVEDETPPGLNPAFTIAVEAEVIKAADIQKENQS